MINQKPSTKLFNIMLKNQDIVIVNIILLIKVTGFGLIAGFSFIKLGLVMSTAAILLILSSWFLLLPNSARRCLLLLFDFLVSIGLVADLLFYRFFHNVISIPILFQASLVGGIPSSVWQLFTKWDFLLFSDLLILVPYLLRLNSQYPTGTLVLRRRLTQVVTIMLVCGITLGLSTKSVAAQFNKNAYVGLNWDDTVLQKLGVVNYHLFDLYGYVKENKDKRLLASDIDTLKTWKSNRVTPQNGNYSGVAKGKNLIVVQVEAMQGFLIGRSVNNQPVTPNLNKLLNSSMYFDNYFTQIGEGNTSDAEFMELNSLYPAPTGSNYILRSQNNYQSLPWVLKDAGYKESDAFHAFKPDFWNRTKMYKAEGFDKFYSMNDFEPGENVGMGLSDESMLKQVVPHLEKLDQPYSSMIITLSGHYPYDIPENKKELNIPKGQFSDLFTNYLQAQHYADKALGQFIEQLQQRGILDNSVLVIYGDHYGTGWTNQDLEQFLQSGQPLNEYSLKELNKVPLFIRLPGGQGAGTKHISGGQMDLYPTLLNLLGISRDKTFYFGQDLLNTAKGFSVFRIWAPEGSFATDDVFYIANRDGKFEDGAAYDRKTGQRVDLHGLQNYYDQARWQLHISDLIMETNSLPQLINISH